jgi:hypothetical protein
MSELDNKPPGLYWAVAVVALIWNLIGVATYLGMVMSEAGARPAVPAWVTGAYAIAVFGGTFGAVGLLLRRAWAVPLFAISLLAVLLQTSYQVGYMVFGTRPEATGLVLPLLILIIAVYLMWASMSAKKKRWIT